MVCEICKQLRVSNVCIKCERKFCRSHKKEYMFKKRNGCCAYWMCDPCYYKSLSVRKFARANNQWLSKLKCPLCRCSLDKYGKCVICIPRKNIKFISKRKTDV